MLGKPFAIVLLVAALLATGLAGIAEFWPAWPRSANTSPLAALFALAWSCTYLAAGALTWRRSRLAVPPSLAAIGLLVVLLWFVFPGSQRFLLPSFVVISVFTVVGCRGLRRALML